MSKKEFKVDTVYLGFQEHDHIDSVQRTKHA